MESAVELLVAPPVHELGGGIRVRRALPSIRRRMVGPFIFLDQLGPATLDGGGLDVRPHPHIGLATLTYLFEGELLHRDSEGNVQRLRPGEVNWMTAGRGIVHSERTPLDRRVAGERLSGLQAWIALPLSAEDLGPSFAHHGAAALPVGTARGVRLRVIAGTFAGLRAPVEAAADLFYAELLLAPGARFSVPARHEERALFLLDGAVELPSEAGAFPPGQLLVLREGADVELRAPEGAHLVLLGGAPLEGERHIWWNFVSSSKERIAEAALAWRDGRFPEVPGESEHIPLPDRPLPVLYP